MNKIVDAIGNVFVSRYTPFVSFGLLAAACVYAAFVQ